MEDSDEQGFLEFFGDQRLRSLHLIIAETVKLPTCDLCRRQSSEMSAANGLPATVD